MAGTLKIEVSGATKEELKRQLEDVIRELDKINFRPGNRVTLGSPQAWKTVGGPQAWKTVASPQGLFGVQQAWKTVGSPQAAKFTGGLRAWTVTYET
jgi:hypothetical protein